MADNYDLIINTIRTLSMDAVEKANSGHPGTPMAMAPVAYGLWDKLIRHAPSDPKWPNRDRFVLSAGHASMLLYSLLFTMGYDITVEDIEAFRQLHSKCAGHPEYGSIPGIECTTGPLGQGLAMSVGMAIAEKWQKSYFNRQGHEIIGYNVFALAGDGCMMEGVSSEAASLAGHLALDNLIWIYDNNHITIEGSTSLAFSEDTAARFKAYGWKVSRVPDANDLQAVGRALRTSVREKSKPSLIIVDSHIAYGAPHKQDSASAHGSPLGEDEIRAAKEFYGWDPDKHFYVPDEVFSYRKKTIAKGKRILKKWEASFKEYEQMYPELADQFKRMIAGDPPDDIESKIPAFPADAKGLATRAVNGKTLNSIGIAYPWLIGGSADLAPSNNTHIEGAGDFSKENYSGRNLHFGVREHAMGAALNGLALSGIRPYGGTFLVFSDYMRPSIRLAAMMKQPVIYVFTHDSIGLGEDGPTHQPIEHLASLRAIPHLSVIRPGDANELAVMWKYVLNLKDSPAALILTRQSLPTIDRDKYESANGALRGGYILAGGENTDIMLIATGSEVQLALEAYEKLSNEGIKCRVVSMPCIELFERQEQGYRDSVIAPSITRRIVIEAGSGFGWGKYAGSNGMVIGIDRFGESAPAKELFAEFGFTVDNLVAKAKEILNA